MTLHSLHLEVGSCTVHPALDPLVELQIRRQDLKNPTLEVNRMTRKGRCFEKSRKTLNTVPSEVEASVTNISGGDLCCESGAKADTLDERASVH